MNRQQFQNTINQAAQVMGKTWPLYSFVTANPLSGYERMPFFDAVEQAGNLLGGCLLPEVSVLRKAWEEGKIGEDEFKAVFRPAGRKESADYYLTMLESYPMTEAVNEYHELDRLTVKWLSLFLDEGMAPWPMPFKEMGFYTAWRKLIVHDGDIKGKLREPIPKLPEEALARVLIDFDQNEYSSIFERHLAALPGWVGFIKYRAENRTMWNHEFPVSLLEYLAVRLWMAYFLDMPILPALSEQKDRSLLELKCLWLEAWEKTWQHNLFNKIRKSSAKESGNVTSRPAAQLVFCLDTRSERLRRLLEKQGNYETFGSAGAFGLLMDYRDPESDLIYKSSPAMAPSRYIVQEVPAPDKEGDVHAYRKAGKRIGIYKYFLKRMKNILPSAFGYVEASGLYFGVFLLLRLFKPNKADRLMLKHRHGYGDLCEPHIYSVDQQTPFEEISMAEKAAIVKGTFDSCGWRSFAPLVVFTGHASHSANNPYGSSLDCGACAGNPGNRNARTLARLANLKEVRELLREKHNISIPEETVFIAAEHITSTDEVKLFDANVPESHQVFLQQLKSDLQEVRRVMAKERLNEPTNAVGLAEIKSNSWSESRPEWGLSGHGGYIIGPRALTLNGEFSDCFMSSYDWMIDQDAAILRGIMQGPLVVVQWISNHYYFSTVDNDKYGGGSKITHNITGKFGVLQGNGSDLKMGLPLQSLMKSDSEVFHNPIRTTTLIQAPTRYIRQIVDSDEGLRRILKNGWIHLFVMDPERENDIEKFTDFGPIQD